MTITTTNRRRILLVEDEALIALSEKRTIEKHGFDVLVAHSGEEAVERALGAPGFDLVLMDIDLGSGIDGAEAAEMILSQTRVPIVFLTSHTERQYVDRVRDITSYGYVVKNSGEFVLIESIRMALKLEERVKELDCLYELERLTAGEDAGTDEMLKRVADLLPTSWQYPRVACARVVVPGCEVASENFETSPWGIAAEIRVHDRPVGSVEVFYREELPEADEGPFLAEERVLIDTVAERLARWIERTIAHEQMLFQTQLLQAINEATVATDLAGTIV